VPLYPQRRRAISEGSELLLSLACSKFSLLLFDSADMDLGQKLATSQCAPHGDSLAHSVPWVEGVGRNALIPLAAIANARPQSNVFTRTYTQQCTTFSFVRTHPRYYSYFGEARFAPTQAPNPHSTG